MVGPVYFGRSARPVMHGDYENWVGSSQLVRARSSRQQVFCCLTYLPSSCSQSAELALTTSQVWVVVLYWSLYKNRGPNNSFQKRNEGQRYLANFYPGPHFRTLAVPNVQM
ncbi:hypothetical protein RvY_08986 [Ramazzottius varieornatus]|uniref:Uncharacterized protein n=1 Tax=Ramazzottius varieornatus TaxID=947166 RepID=A0A1D1V7X0_RAMVA|nr:hypothetical protein RvY_08986 [Ramazzottius varieornatus]